MSGSGLTACRMLPLALIVATAWLGVAVAQTPAALPPSADPAAEAPAVVPEPDARLEAMRAELRALRFEAAIAAASRLLEDEATPEPVRIEALRVRIAANISIGQRSAVEADFRRVLALEPGFEPDPSSTPKRTLERFAAIRDATIGRLRLQPVPPTARVSIDGREFDAPEGSLALVAGQHTLSISHVGFETDERLVEIEAGVEAGLEIELAQIARTLRVETVVDGVEVLLDGVSVGRTSKTPERFGSAALELPWLALGEHRIELRKPCHRGEQRELLLTVDLMDSGPFRVGPIDLLEVRSTVRPSGGPPGARVELDGEIVGALPVERLEMCPGEHELVIRLGDRVAWSELLEIEQSEDRLLNVAPRPNAVVLGAPSLRGDAQRLAGRVSLRPRDGILGAGDEFEPDVDLVIVRSTSGRWELFSPWLKRSAALEADSADWSKPEWLAPSWGLQFADSATCGVACVVELAAAGAAATAGLLVGDRLLEIGGVRVESAAAARAVLSVASTRSPLPVRWERRVADGRRSPMRGELRGTAQPVLPPAPDDPLQAIWRAAWAAVDAECDPRLADAARANLAALLSAAGRHRAAVRLWARVGWPDRPGIGAGTVAYWLGRDLEALAAAAGAPDEDRRARLAEAADAYRRAAASAASGFSDDGPPVAPAARDRLADLGHDTGAR